METTPSDSGQPRAGEQRARAARERVGRSLLTFGEQRTAGPDAVMIGTFLIELPSVATVRTLAMAGFSFVVIDVEHSALDIAGIEPLLSEARACGLGALVRVPGDRLSLIGNVLDAGANGVMVPHVNAVEQAREVVSRARFAPIGERGFSPLTLIGSIDHPQAQLNEGQLVILQIEGRAGVLNASAISRVEGVDGIFVGPYDLAEALGTPSDISSPAVLSAADEIARDLSADRLLGIYMDDPRMSVSWAARGFRLQCVSFDGQMLLHRAREVVNATEDRGDHT